MSATSTEGRSSATIRRGFLLILAAALVAHAVLLWNFIDRALESKQLAGPVAVESAYVAVPTIAGVLLLLWKFPRHAHAVAAAVVFAIAACLLSPGVVVTIGAMLLCAYVVGDRAIALARDASAPPLELAPAVTVLVGIALWIGLIAATLPLRVHVQPVYVTAMLLPLLVFRRVTAAAVVRLFRWLATSRANPGWTERIWIALLVALVAIHVFLVARPDAGFDAQAMHLQFAQMLREHRHWTFDVTRYAWAVMPLGADLQFAAAYMVGGESAASTLNLAFAFLAALIAYDLIALHARREIALASIALLASTPLVFLETATLYVENLWTAFLLASLLLALHFARERRRETLCAFAWVAAGAMQCKIIGVIWLVPLGAAMAWMAWTARGALRLRRRDASLLGLAALVGAWPYVNAWVRTGNPAFPFVNALFGSPYFDTSASFNNENYNAPLAPGTLYDIVLSSSRFIEGADGALGAQWLLLIPIAVIGLVCGRPRAQWMSLALAALFFVVVYMHQSYLRYLLPSLVMLAVFCAWVLQDLPDSTAMRVAVLAVGAGLCAVNVRLMPAAHLPNNTLCLKCSYDADTRRKFVELYAPHRVLSERLNRTLPHARIGFLLVNAESPAGYVGLFTLG